MKPALLLLGASEFPTGSFDSDRLRREAHEAVKRYFLAESGLSLDTHQCVLDLFDSPKVANEQVSMIEDWVRKLVALSTPCTDLFIHYVGHGEFKGGNSQDYYLAIKTTRNYWTGLAIEQLADLLRKRASSLRKFLIIDACFAGSAALYMGGPDQAMVRRTKDAAWDGANIDQNVSFPKSGTYALCSCSKNVPAQRGSELGTKFTHGLLSALRAGGIQVFTSESLSFEQVTALTELQLKALYGEDVPPPVGFESTPERGRVGAIPLLRNANPRLELVVPSNAPDLLVPVTPSKLQRHHNRIGVLVQHKYTLMIAYSVVIILVVWQRWELISQDHNSNGMALRPAPAGGNANSSNTTKWSTKHNSDHSDLPPTSALPPPGQVLALKEGMSVDYPDVGLVRCNFTGLGFVAVRNTGPSPAIHLVPKRSESETETHSASLLGPWFQNLTLACSITSIAQVRATGRVPWQVGWVQWHYKDHEHFYYFLAKSNGWELGKAIGSGGKTRFLITGTTPWFDLGKPHKIIISQVGANIEVFAGDASIAKFSDTDHPYLGGKIGFYSEDADVQFDKIQAKKRN